jgi:hypothetical protein
MEINELNSFLDHQRWLINNGLVNPIVQDNLFMYGILSHPEVKEVDVALDALNKKVSYGLFFETKMLNAIEKYKKLSGDRSLLGTFRLWLLLKKHGNLEFKSPLSKMIKDYCGPGWEVSVDIKNVSEYRKEFN